MQPWKRYLKTYWQYRSTQTLLIICKSGYCCVLDVSYFLSSGDMTFILSISNYKVIKYIFWISVGSGHQRYYQYLALPRRNQHVGCHDKLHLLQWLWILGLSHIVLVWWASFCWKAWLVTAIYLWIQINLMIQLLILQGTFLIFAYASCFVMCFITVSCFINV